MKNRIFIYCLIFILLAVSFAAGFFVTKSQAVVPLAFGGMLIGVTECTCSGSLWLLYAPLGAPSPFPGGPLNYSLYSTITYSFYNVTTPGVWHMGLYLPGVQGCWIFVVEGCAPLPVVGSEVMVGTSTTVPKDNTGANDLSPNTLQTEGATVNSLNQQGVQIPGMNAV